MLGKGEEGGDGSGAPKYLTIINTETGLVTIVGQTVTDLDVLHSVQAWLLVVKFYL